MRTKKSINELFTASGCLTQEALLAYIDGSLASGDQKSVTDHLSSCAFCRDAADGLTGIKDPQDIVREVTLLNKRILQQAASQSPCRHQPVLKKMPALKTWTYAAAAASIILFIGFYFIIDKIGTDRDTVWLAAVTDTNVKVIDSLEPTVGPSKSIQAVTPPEIQPVTSPEAPGEPAVAMVTKTEHDEISSQFERLADTSEILTEKEEGLLPSERPVTQDAEVIGGIKVTEEEGLLQSVRTGSGRAEKDNVFITVKQMPEFPGGTDSLDAFIRKNLRYPPVALSQKIEGQVFVKFVIDQQGKVTDAFIRRGIGGGCDEEALRIVNAMPDWIPGKQHGTPVRVQYTLTVPFIVPDQE